MSLDELFERIADEMSSGAWDWNACIMERFIEYALEEMRKVDPSNDMVRRIEGLLK
jgi:hypothetical protein